MKIHSALAGALFLMLNLCACGSTQPELSEDMISEIYTAAVMTALVKANPVVRQQPVEAAATGAPTINPTNSPIATAQPAATVAPISYASGCDQAAYVSDVTISDGTILEPGEEFVKTWQLLNTGTCTWNANYSITFVSGEDMDGYTTEIDKTTAPGETAQVSIALIAPDSEGTYTGYWAIMNPQGLVFGEQVYVHIVVAGEAATETPTPTATERPASTLTPTPSATTTDTPMPTDTPIDIPPETPTQADE